MELIVIAIVVAVLGLYFVGLYNRLVTKRNQLKNSFSQIDVQLKRRYDLIPNLVESAKAYLAHEKETLSAVIQARNQAVTASQVAASHPESADAIGALGRAEATLGASMGRLFAVMESYPDLKANQTIQGLMEELTATENKVSFARQHYNDSVMEFNNARENFPAVVFSGAMGFQQASQLLIEDERERQAVRVKF